jgi:hypothetical protein
MARLAMKSPEDLRREAARCRRLAAEITDRWTIDALLQLAEEFEKAAATLEEAAANPDPDRE